MTGGVKYTMAIGNAKNIIVGAGALYVGATTGTEYVENTLPAASATLSGSVKRLTDPANVDSTDWKSVGYTSEGAELSFEPDFGEVQVDQLLDVAKIFKQGQRVMVNTTLTEATLENMLIVLGADADDLSGASTADIQTFTINGGSLGVTPVERSLAIIGPGPESKTTTGEVVERVYLAYRALSMDTVTVGIRRNEATVFPVSFRLLASSTNTAADGNAAYGKIIDRVFTPA
jgi:hypothetical protein